MAELLFVSAPPDQESWKVATCKILVLLAALFPSWASAQNLVPNSGFETFTVCPNFQDQLSQAPPWTKPTIGSPDYYNTCAGSGTFVGVPANDFGSQTPNSGNAYAGFILRPINVYREYLEVPLTSPLVGGAAYQVSFYVSLSDQSQWGIDKIGAYLSVGPVGPIGNALPLPVTPQVANPAGNNITSKTAWTLISGMYIAVGGENHLVIGNFADNASTTPVTGLGGFYQGSYYYVDDVSVTSLACDHLPDGSDCAPTVCPNPGDTCRPMEIIVVPGAGPSVSVCDCVNPDECYVFPGPHGIPLCGGLVCPGTAQSCQLTATTFPNGTISYECCAGTPPQEACCLPDGKCASLPVDSCENQGGTALGSGTQCTGSEACCFRGGACESLDPLCCLRIGGSPEGSGTACQGIEGCCFADGSCQDLDAQCCGDSGSPLGASSTCQNDSNGDGIDDACCDVELTNEFVADLTTAVRDDGSAIAINGSDDTWTVTCEATPNGSLPRPATVIDGASIGPWATIPGSQWISANFFGPNGDYCYESCFCLADGFKNATLVFQIHADDSAGSGFPGGVSLNGQLLIVNPGSPPPSFINPPASFTITDQMLFHAGTNCLQVVVNNSGGAPTGFNAAGQVTADNGRCCCEPDSSGLRCRSVDCANGAERCTPRLILHDPCKDQTTVEQCDCIQPSQCRLIMGPHGPTCVGRCPAFKRCTLLQTDENMDGIDEFRCACGDLLLEGVGDIDNDGDTDLIDFGLMQNAFTGPE